jgi:hypothetical protein
LSHYFGPLKWQLAWCGRCNPLPLKPFNDDILKRPKTPPEEAAEKNGDKDVATSITSDLKKVKKDSGDKKANSSVGRKIISTSDDDSDFEEKKKSTKKKKEPSKKKPVALQESCDFWVEVYLEEEERWVSVDLSTFKVLCDSDLEVSLFS